MWVTLNSGNDSGKLFNIDHIWKMSIVGTTTYAVHGHLIGVSGGVVALTAGYATVQEAETARYALAAGVTPPLP